MDNEQPSDSEWRSKLSPEQFRVLRMGGTEPPFSGELLDVKDKGRFMCAGCGEPLFDSDSKYDSGSGWPSFTRPQSDEAVNEVRDASHGMVRTEVRCARCEGHLGHVFDDGPGPEGLRYCINSASLAFAPQEKDDGGAD